MDGCDSLEIVPRQLMSTVKGKLEKEKIFRQLQVGHPIQVSSVGRDIQPALCALESTSLYSGL